MCPVHPSCILIAQHNVFCRSWYKVLEVTQLMYTSSTKSLWPAEQSWEGVTAPRGQTRLCLHSWQRMVFGALFC